MASSAPPQNQDPRDTLPPISREQHLHYLRECLVLSRHSPPKPTNFRVGAMLVSYSSSSPASGTVLSTGYTLELPDNTHAEQNCLTKLLATSGSAHSSQAPMHSPANYVSAGGVSPLTKLMPPEKMVVLYTTLEPCSVRLSGNMPCVQRIVNSRSKWGTGGVRKVVFGAKEPGVFVQDSKACQLLSEAGVEWEYIPDLEEQILEVAKEGHAKEGTRIDDITEEERERQKALPKNRKKRMMESLGTMMTSMN